MKSEDNERRVRVLSLNCWYPPRIVEVKLKKVRGLKILSQHRQLRMRALGDKLATCNYDLLCLQEVWVQEDFLYIQAKVRQNLPYSHYYYSAFLGSGLAIFSRWPILSTSMFPYQLNGRPAAVWRGDWYAGKGAATALIRHHTGALIEVFTTHFHAAYGKGEDTYLCHRNSQGWQIAKLIRGAVERGRFVIAAGDFNCYPDSIVHSLVTQHGLVSDAWEAVHPPSQVDIQFLSDQAQIDVLGVTNESKLNTFRPDNLESTVDDANAKRIDYVFTSQALIEDARVVFTEHIPGHDMSYSDHFGVSVTLQLPEDVPCQIPSGHIPPEIFNSVREVTTSYVLREERYSILRIAHFIFSVVVCVSMLTGVWFVEQKGCIFIMMFISTMCSWCGVLDWVIGYVWGRWELRALKEFAAEMDLARKVYAQEGVFRVCE